MLKILWEGIEITINYTHNYSNIYDKIYGDIMSHIEISAMEELPITETGYRSIFILQSNLNRWGGVEKYVIDELNKASKSDAWQFKQLSKNQLCLF